MVRRSHAAALFLVVFSVTILATTPDASRAAVLGAQLGVDRTGLDGDSPPNTGYIDKGGLIAGIQGEFGIGHNIALSLQPSFVQKKSGLQFAPVAEGAPTTEFELAFDYFSVPILAKFAAASGRTYVAGGVTLDFLSSAKLSGEGVDRDVKSSYKSTGLGAVLGLGFVFPVGGTRLTTEVRFVQGLSNMVTGSAAEAAGALAPRLHSHGLELIVGDLFTIGGKR